LTTKRIYALVQCATFNQANPFIVTNCIFSSLWDVLCTDIDRRQARVSQ